MALFFRPVLGIERPRRVFVKNDLPQDGMRLQEVPGGHEIDPGDLREVRAKRGLRILRITGV